MNSKKRLVLSILVLVLLIGCAYVLYGQIGDDLDAQQLGVNEAPVENDTVDSSAASQQAEDESSKAPDFKMVDAEGNEQQFYNFLGKPIVLNFWASWCGPCQMEMPDFEEAYKNYGEEVNFLMVNMTDGSRETVDTASEFISAQGYTFPVYYDTAQEAAYGYGVYSLPTTYFIDAEGNAIAYARGAINAETLQQGLDAIMP